MHFLHIELAVLVLLKTDTEAVEFLDDAVAFLRVTVDGCLITDAIVRDRDLLGVLFGGRIAGNDRVIEPVHAHRDRAGALDVGLV